MPTQIRRLTTIYGTTTYGLRVLEWNGKGQLGKYVSKPGISSGLKLTKAYTFTKIPTLEGQTKYTEHFKLD